MTSRSNKPTKSRKKHHYYFISWPSLNSILLEVVLLVLLGFLSGAGMMGGRGGEVEGVGVVMGGGGTEEGGASGAGA